MTKITRITTQKRNKHRYNVFIDEGQGEKFGFSLDEDILVQFNLRKNLELDEAMIKMLLQQDTLHQSYNQVIGYLGYRMRTRKEIYDYLFKKEVADEHIEQIIKKLIERKLIDDKEFADSFVRTRIQMSTKGPGLVKRELIEKGITQAIANQSTEQYSYSIQYEKASKVAEKRSKKTSRHSFRKQQQQLQATLMRNGFTQEVIRDVLENIADVDNDAEMEALSYHGTRIIRRHQEKLTGYELKNKLKESLYRQGFTIESINNYLDKMTDDNHM